MSKKVIFVAANGFEETELVAPLDILRRCGAEVELLTIEKEITVLGSRGIKLIADGFFHSPADVTDIDMIVLPGGSANAQSLLHCQALHQTLASAAQQGKLIGAICAAPMILAHCGLLRGKKATIYPGMENELIDAQPMKLSTVIDGNYITSRGAGASIEFGLALAKELFGSSKSMEIAKQIARIQ